MERTSAPPRRQRSRRARSPRSLSASRSSAAGVALLAHRGALARRLLGVRRLRLLRARLHGLAQAPDAAEHRHRRRRGRGAAARRLGGRRRLGHRHRRRALRDRVPLDAAPLLGARAAARGGLRAGGRADAADRARLPRRARARSSSTRVLLVAASLVPVALGHARAGSTRSRPLLLGGRFIWLAVRLLRAPDDRATARRTFLYSLLYLALLFAAMGLDSALLS